VAGVVWRPEAEARVSVAELVRRAAEMHRAGRLAEAESLYREALAAEPRNASLHNDLGVAQQDLGRLDAAERSFRAAAACDPTLVDPVFNLGLLCLRGSRINEAVACLKRAVALDPDHGRAHALLAEILVRQGDAVEGGVAARRAAALRPDDFDLQRGLGKVLADLADWDGALACWDRALALRPGDPATVAGKAAVLGNRGDVEAAYGLIEPLLAGDVPDPRAALVLGLHARRLGRQEEALERVERALGAPGLGWVDRKDLCFVAGRLHDALGHYEAAFARYAEGNRLAAEGLEAVFVWPEAERIIAAFGAARLAAMPRASERAAAGAERVVFIVGMPRSGTTLVEQILASHPQVHGAGELHDVARMTASLPHLLKTRTPYPECAAGLTPEVADTLARWYLDRLGALAPDAARVTDKMPQNFLHLGLIARCLPGARVIHCVRDPVDTCLSCYFQDFGGGHGYAYDLEELGRTYRDYRRLMAHWGRVLDLPLHTVAYEAMVAEPERESRALVDFCGLDWDPACLRFHESGRHVRTSSRDQVNRPIYRSSAGRRRHYERHLGPLLAALGPDADLTPGGGSAGAPP
jgi:tetratricopeptide (TPR) repeat protein